MPDTLPSDALAARRALIEKRIGQKLAAAARQRIRPRPGGGPAPLSFAQQRLWFLDQLSPGNPFYNIPIALRMSAQLDPGAVERSLNVLVSRHEILRTTFTSSEGQPSQVAAPSLHVPLKLVDLRKLTATEREAETLRLATEEAQQPFDLASGPLLRAALLRLDSFDYIFLLAMHHIISDGWSMGVFFRELTAVYQAMLWGLPSPLPPLEIQFADYALWQRHWLQGDVLDKQLAYWKQQLEGLEPLELPTDRPRPAVQTFRGAHHMFVLPPSLTDHVRTFSRSAGATVFMTLLAAFKVLLFRYSGQSDIAAGSYIAGRNRTELEGLIGFFLNTLVLRTDLSGDPSFRELVERVRVTALGAYDHQDLPFEKLVEELHPERTLSRNPLCQVAFQLQNATTAATGATATGSAAPALNVDRGSAIFDLAVTVCESGDELLADIEYSTELYDPATIERAADHFRNLLQQAVESPETNISALSLFGASEYRTIMHEWSASRTEPLDGRAITELFEARVERMPRSPAFLCDGAQLSYAELNASAEHLAARLRELGVRPGAVVGVCVERSLDAPVALLGILKAGAIYLPLDPSYPRERLEYMLENAGASVVITRPAQCGELQLVVHPESRGRELPAGTAYLIYTSGSTGRPKGVAAPHTQILNRLQWMWREYPFDDGEVCCQKTPLSFVDSLWELLGPLLQGVPAVILPEEVVQDADALVEQLALHRVTRIWMVPSLLQAVLDSVTDLGRRLPHLRFWVSSGEPLSAQLYNRFRAGMPHATLYNLYGSSEVWDATWYDPGDEERQFWRVPIGRPIDNVQLYVLDGRRQPSPIGVPGELYVAGAGLARYLDADQTAGRFHMLPFAPHRIAFQTGDLVRWLPDGNLEFLGRLDRQVQVRGFRVEPAEIEAAMLRHPGVRRAAVVLHRDRLVALVEPRSDPPADAAELRRVLAGTLPDFMIPSAFATVASLPMTPSGKIDRRAIPQSVLEETHLERSFTPPRSDVERTIAAIWQEVLHLDTAGIHDNFFDLGGHSLLVTQVVSRMRKNFGIEFPIGLFFEAPTVAELAQAVEQRKRDGHVAAAPIQRLSRDAYRTT